MQWTASRHLDRSRRTRTRYTRDRVIGTKMPGPIYRFLLRQHSHRLISSHSSPSSSRPYWLPSLDVELAEYWKKKAGSGASCTLRQPRGALAGVSQIQDNAIHPLSSVACFRPQSTTIFYWRRRISRRRPLRPAFFHCSYVLCISFCFYH